MEEINFKEKNRQDIFARKMEFSSIVDSLCENSFFKKRKHQVPLPSKETTIQILEDIKRVLFPGYFGKSEVNADNMKYYVGAILDKIARTFQIQIKKALCFTCEHESIDCHACNERALVITQEFIESLPSIQEALLKDVNSAYEGDPAAKSPDETILCYPGIHAITSYRIAHELYMRDVPLIPRIITEHAHTLTGIDIHPGALIGEAFFIDHGTGVVIGETCVIGNRVRIYQGVTLGAKSFPLDKNGKPIKGIERHPIVEDDVIIYSGATILGRITIGQGSIIGGNVWLTRSVPPFSKVVQSEFRQDEIFKEGAGI